MSKPTAEQIADHIAGFLDGEYFEIDGDDYAFDAVFYDDPETVRLSLRPIPEVLGRETPRYWYDVKVSEKDDD